MNRVEKKVDMLLHKKGLSMKQVIRKQKRNLLIWLLFTTIFILGFNLVIPILTRQEPLKADSTDSCLPTAEGDTYSDATNPTNLYLEDSNDATMNDGAANDQDVYNFEYSSTDLYDLFSSGCTINGIEVEIKAEKSAGVTPEIEVTLTGDDYSTTSATKTNVISSSDKYIYGSSSDLWNYEWTDETSFSNANFRVYLHIPDDGDRDGVLIDYVSVVVSYTPSDTDGPIINFTFVGNTSDYGGPYWIPPNENLSTSGPYAGDGYYTNSSMQSEDFIYVNATITDISGVTGATVCLYDYGKSTWANHSLSNTVGDCWEYTYVSMGKNTTFALYINATDGTNYNITAWNKTGVEDQNTLRKVTVHCTPTNISYLPLYFYMSENPENDGTGNQYDRGKYDGGINPSADTSNDTGWFNTTLNDDTVHEIHCGNYLGAFFADDICVESNIVTNMYYHVWQNTSSGVNFTFHGLYKTRGKNTFVGMSDSNKDNHTVLDKDKSSVDWDNDVDGAHPDHYGTKFYLQTGIKDLGVSYSITDNDVYELLFICMTDSTNYPIQISNRSFTSFILFNVPDNTTLNATGDGDSDDDGLSDWTELYVTYTNPFLSDTDNDGKTDHYETIHGIDPNDYTNKTCWNSTTDTINGTYTNTTIWNVESKTINGTYSNNTQYHTVSSTINGTYTSITTWTITDNAINGTYTNTTSWDLTSNTINGTYINGTIWKSISTTINGSYINGTSWNTVTNTVNGSYINNTIWSIITDTINGTWSNTSTKTWNTIINTINGTYTNTTSFHIVINTINGTYINRTDWSVESDTINGTYANSTTLKIISDTINGSYTNTTVFQIVDSTVNGSYVNVTTWKAVTNAINGTYTNVSTKIWNTVINTINGTYTNTTSWDITSNTINGTYINRTDWSVESDTINGSYINGTSWNIISNTINGSYSNVSTIVWNIVSTIINGSYANTSILNWHEIISTINGSYTNTSVITWNIESDTINGSYTNTSEYTVIIDDINGTYTNSSDQIIITIMHPLNNSVCDAQPTLVFSLSHPSGALMNYTIYTGNSSVDTTAYLTNDSFVSDGIFYFNNYYNATENGVYYWWRVSVNDSSQRVNETVRFMPSNGAGQIISTPGFELGVFLISIIGCMFTLLYSKRKRLKI